MILVAIRFPDRVVEMVDNSGKKSTTTVDGFKKNNVKDIVKQTPNAPQYTHLMVQQGENDRAYEVDLPTFLK